MESQHMPAVTDLGESLPIDNGGNGGAGGDCVPGTTLSASVVAEPRGRVAIGIKVSLFATAEAVTWRRDCSRHVQYVHSGTWSLMAWDPYHNIESDISYLLSTTSGLTTSFITQSDGIYRAYFETTFAGNSASAYVVVVAEPQHAEYVGPDIPVLSNEAWKLVSVNSPSGRCVAIAGVPSALYTVGHGGGVWKSVDGESWSFLSGSPAPDDLDERFSLATQTGNEQHVLVGGSKGLFESIDGGITWSQLFDSKALAVAIDDDGRVFAGVDDSIAVRVCTFTQERWHTILG